MREPFLVRSGNFFFRWRDAIAPLVFLSLLLIARPDEPLGSERVDLLLDAVGLLLALTGQAIRMAAVGFEYIVRGGKGRAVYADGLVTGGLFAASRNPLYLGNLLILLGLFVVWNSRWMYLVGIPFFLFVYRSIVAAEEAFLARKFGPAYDDYCRAVPRWIPDLARLGGGLRDLTFNWRRVVLKEYGTTAAWVLTALLLLALEAGALGSADLHRRQLPALGWTALATVSLWATARWLKRTRRLRA